MTVIEEMGIVNLLDEKPPKEGDKKEESPKPEAGGDDVAKALKALPKKVHVVAIAEDAIRTTVAQVIRRQRIGVDVVHFFAEPNNNLADRINRASLIVDNRRC